jgi:hypothetical protein
MNNKKIKIKKKNNKKKAGGVAQGVGPEFKPHTHKNYIYILAIISMMLDNIAKMGDV